MWWWGNSWHHKCNSSSVVGNPSPRYLPICLPYILECSSVGTPCYSDMECIPENPPPDVIVAGKNSSFPMHSTVKKSASSRLGIILYVTGLPTYSVVSYNFFMCKTTPLSMPEVPCNFRSPCRQVSRKGGVHHSEIYNHNNRLSQLWSQMKTGKHIKLLNISLTRVLN